MPSPMTAPNGSSLAQRFIALSPSATYIAHRADIGRAGILDSMEDAGAAPQLYRGIDHFIAALQGTQETGQVATFENGSHPGILVRIDGRAIGAVALEQGETRDMLSARVHELLG